MCEEERECGCWSVRRLRLRFAQLRVLRDCVWQRGAVRRSRAELQPQPATAAPPRQHTHQIASDQTRSTSAHSTAHRSPPSLATSLPRQTATMRSRAPPDPALHKPLSDRSASNYSGSGADGHGISGGGGGGGGQHGHSSGGGHSLSQHASSKYLCTLYGVVRYDALGSAPGAAPLSATQVVSRLCSLLRAMCHSDSQQLMQGKQALALLDLPAPPPVPGTAAFGGAAGFFGARPQTPLTPSAAASSAVHAASPGSSVSMLPPPSPSNAGAAAFGIQPPPPSAASNASVFFPGGPSVNVTASAEALRAREAAAAAAAAAANPHAAHAAPALAFPSVPLFHQASHTLMAHTQLPSQSSVAPSFVASTTAAFAAASAAANADRTYLLARETRLAPITAMVAGQSNWASMVPPRFSRYTRVYKPLPPVTGPGGQPAALAAQAALAAAGTDLWAWREIELHQSQAPVPGFLAPNANAAHVSASAAGATTGPGSATGAGGSNLSSSLSASAAATAAAATASSPTPWFLSSLGKPLLPSKSLCNIRSLRLVSLSSNYESLLTNPSTLAYQRDWEFVQEGFRFEDRDGIEILLFQVLRVSTPGEIQSAQAIKGNRWIVEVRAIAGEDAVQNVQTKVASYAKGLEQSVGRNTRPRSFCSSARAAC